MKSAQRSVVLLSGWLLLAPPYMKGCLRGGYNDASAPLAKWEQLAVFDTAEECQDVLFTVKERIGDMAPENAAKGDAAKLDKLNRLKSLTVSKVEAARCVPAEHIYPPAQGAIAP